MLTRRHVIASALAAPAILRFGTGTAHAATTLKISHQFPGGTIDKGDFRDRLCRMFAAEVAKRSGGEIAAEIYPNSSLIKTNAQFSAMRKGALDISLYPMPYAGGELPETNIGLMPGLVATYDQGLRWKKEPVGKALTDFLADKGIILLTWVWQAGGVASRSKPIVAPEDAKGLKVRGGSREMDMVLQTAGAAVLSVPSNEIYAAMQTGACDAGITSSTSLISFRLEEVAKVADLGRRRVLLVHAGAADDVEGDLRQAAQEPAGHHPGGRQRTGSVRHARARRTTISRSPRSMRRPAPRSASSTWRPSASGGTLRAIPPGRTTAPRPRRRPICSSSRATSPHDAWSASGSTRPFRAPPRAIRSWRRSARRWRCATTSSWSSPPSR